MTNDTAGATRLLEDAEAASLLADARAAGVGSRAGAHAGASSR